MKRLIMEVRKFNRVNGQTFTHRFDLTPLMDELTPEEIFMMEYKINEIPSVRVHLSIR
jgi:hypothetical protein